MNTFSLDDFDETLPPPRFLYKYLSAERVENVLEGGTVRFTPLLDTNDTFEVRSTFDQLAGPKMQNMLFENMEKTLSEELVVKKIAGILRDSGLDMLPPEIAMKLAEQYYGRSIIDILRTQMQDAVNTVLVPHFNSPESAEIILEKFGRDLLCFSLSERMDSPPMWAHYAANNTGFIVAFNTENAWFRRPENGEKTRLQRVAYFDGKLNEPFDNPNAAFISKTTDWAYEREWRLYIKSGEADLTVGSVAEPIHLLKFPPEAVDRIILGSKTRPEVATRIREAVASRYPHAALVRAVPNRESHTSDEVLI
jgi:hypothetical protein